MEKKDKTLNVPHLRFPEFSGEWEYHELQSIAPKISSGKDKPNNEGTVVLYGSTGIMGHTTTESYKSEIVIVARVGANAGQLQLVDIPCGVTDNALVVDAKSWNKYVFYYLQHFNLNKLVYGSGQPLITGGMLKKIKIWAGNNVERNKIVHLLSLMEERIDTQKKIIEKYESLIRGIVETHYSQCECIKQVRISELGEPFTTMNMSKEDLSEEGNECILYGELFTTYGCVIKEVKSRTHISTDKATISRSNDMLFPASTTVDAISLIAPSAICKEGVILGGDLFGIHVNKDYNNEYLSYLINYIYKSKLARYAQGSTIIHLHYSDIKKATLLLPTIEEQNYLAYLMRGVEEKIDIEKDMLSQLYRQKAYILSSLFI